MNGWISLINSNLKKNEKFAVIGNIYGGTPYLDTWNSGIYNTTKGATAVCPPTHPPPFF